MEIDEPIEIVEYDPSWADQFDDEGVAILEAMGDGARDIEHVGSTAVPGMPSRPILDIMVGVASIETASRHVVDLQAIDYEYVGDTGVLGRLHFRKRGEIGVNVGFVEYGGERWRLNRRLRDFLRESTEEAKRYGAIKRELVADGYDTWSTYTRAKAEHLDELIERSES